MTLLDARDFAPSDLGLLKEMAAQPTVRRADALPDPKDEEGWRRFIAARQTGRSRLFILDRAGRGAGFIVLMGTHVPEIFEIGYAIHEAHQGQGLATRALRATLPAVFQGTACQRLQAVTEPGNAPSRRVLEKCGFEHEGVLRKGLKLRGGLVDAAIYARLKGARGALAQC